MKGRILLFILITIGVFACEQEKFYPGFTGITETDESGVVLKSDTNDWQFNDEWESSVENLFDEGFPNTCSLENYLYKVVAYPNPCIDVCYLYINIPMGHRFQYRIVDNELNVLLSGETDCSALTINVADLQRNKDVVRMYYKILNHDCELRGHGDLLIQ